MRKKEIGLKNLDIILPVYDPKEGWTDQVIADYNALKEKLPHGVVPYLIIVNDGSPENLDEELHLLAENLENCITISYAENKGKGFALRTAFKSSASEYCIFTDYDFPYDLESMTAMIEAIISDHYDAVIGIRDEGYYTHLPAKRRRISRLLKWLNKILMGLPTDDTQCGLKAFNQKGRSIVLQTKTNRYLIDLEILKRMARSKLKIGTQVVHIKPGIKATKISNLSLSMEFLSFLRILLSV